MDLSVPLPLNVLPHILSVRVKEPPDVSRSSSPSVSPSSSQPDLLPDSSTALRPLPASLTVVKTSRSSVPFICGFIAGLMAATGTIYLIGWIRIKWNSSIET